ncbi:MAG: hypothetical protein K5858_11440 [Lachnospiraceae bacterium]|nr:hypothetical protein [Lachnospiraceae bacterium]
MKKRGFIIAISVIACLSAVFFIIKGIKRPEIPVKHNKTSITVHIAPQDVSRVRYHFSMGNPDNDIDHDVELRREKLDKLINYLNEATFSFYETLDERNERYSKMAGFVEENFCFLDRIEKKLVGFMPVRFGSLEYYKDGNVYKHIILDSEIDGIVDYIRNWYPTENVIQAMDKMEDEIRFSDKMQEMVDEMYKKISWLSSARRSCKAEFDTWEDAMDFLGTDLWNPFEKADGFEFGYYSDEGARPDEEPKDPYHCYMNYWGSSDAGHQYAEISTGYKQDSAEITVEVYTNKSGDLNVSPSSSMTDFEKKVIHFNKDGVPDLYYNDTWYNCKIMRETYNLDDSIIDSAELIFYKDHNPKYHVSISTDNGDESLTNAFNKVCEELGLSVSYEEIFVTE